MKSLFFYLLLSVILAFVSPLFAQTDSLSAGDTISINRQRILFSVIRTYRYHLASSLQSNQMVPLLKLSHNEDVNNYIRRFRWHKTVWLSMMFSSLPALYGGISQSRRRPELARGLSLGGIFLFYGSALLRPERNMERAVQSHNMALRSISGDYYRPMFDLRPQSDRINLTDTVLIKGRFLYPKFMYRGVRVDPATNLKLAFKYLNSGRIESNMRYIRGLRGISGFLSGLASSTLSLYLLYYAARRANGPYPINRGIIYPALGTIGLGVVANWHVNRQQVGTMRAYNGKLKGVRSEKLLTLALVVRQHLLTPISTLLSKMNQQTLKTVFSALCKKKFMPQP